MESRERLDPRAVLAANAALLVAYVAAAEVVLRFALVDHVAAVVWPSIGLAVAAVLRFGSRLLPAVLVAEAIVMLRLRSPPVIALVVAAADTLEVGLVTYAVRRYGGFTGKLDGLHVVTVLIVASLVAATVGGTIAVGALAIGGEIPPSDVLATGRAWWTSNVLGAFIVTPLLLAWGTFRRTPVRGRTVLELLLLGALLVAASIVVFFRTDVGGTMHEPWIFFPLLVWAAYRFRLLGAVTATALLAVIAFWGTLRGAGPFAVGTRAGSLLALQTFLACAALTPIVLAVAVADRARAVRARDDFIAVAGHELRTPLTSLMLQIDALERALKREPVLNVPERVARIASSARRLERLVAQLLDVSRITAGKLKLEPESLDLAAVVRDVVARFRDAGGKAAPPIVVTSTDEICGRWDRLRIDQVVTNLVSNAVKYGAGKPIEVDVQLDSEAVLRVTDHGIGIDPESRTRLFQRFERAVDERHIGGLGLGLWIARQIVEASGGAIAVESRVGGGSVFTVRLPLDGPARHGGAG